MKKILFSLFYFFVIIDLANAINKEQLDFMIDIGFNSAVINVKVDTECYSRLMYGLKPNKLTGLVMNADMLTDHKFEILNLLEGKKYYFQIEFYNNDFSVKTAIKEIQTLGIATPEILNKKIECYVKSAELSIKTNVPVKYRLKTAEQILENLEYKNDIVVKIENLKSGAAYEYELILMNEKNVELIDSGIIKTLDNNIALNKKVEGTFDINPEPNVIANSPSIISRITDGKIHYFTGMATSGNVKEAQQNVIIDLEEEQFIEKIKVYWRAIAYSKNYYVMISSDKKKWNYIGKNIDASKGITMRSESGDPLFVNEIAANNKARYIRIWLAKNSEFYCKFDNWNFVQIFEIEAINNQI